MPLHVNYCTLDKDIVTLLTTIPSTRVCDLIANFDPFRHFASSLGPIPDHQMRALSRSLRPSTFNSVSFEQRSRRDAT